MKFADLHLHTIFSDGTYTPEELIDRAKDKGLSAIAITDHDTVKSIAPAVEAGIAKGIEVLAGIELTSEYEGTEIHLLGYLIDYENRGLKEKLVLLSRHRVERIHKITDKLKELGVNLGAEAVFKVARQGNPGRLHVARALVQKGFIASTAEAFRRYIGDKCPAYVLGFKLSPQEGIKLIKDAGGIPVLAHPCTLNRDELIPLFVDFGLMGIEVYYPEHTHSMVNFYLDLARKYNLLVTGGSDCHGRAKPEEMIGSVKIPYELVEKLKNTTSAL